MSTDWRQIAFAFYFALQTIAVAAPAMGEAPRAPDEWYVLFDGETLNGWKPVVENGAFAVRDGMIEAGGAQMNHLFYVGPVRKGHFKNFELKLEVMTTPGSNSGVFFHTKPREGFLLKGYEAQINATHKDRRKTGSLLDVKHLTEPPAKDNQWLEYHIIVDGQRIVVKVDGETTVDYTEPPNPKRSKRRKNRILSSGQFALQGHDPNSIAYFKNIRVKPLPDNGPVVSVVVGDLLPEEGGPVKAERSPLTSPFGVDFDSAGNMVIIELAGGRIHRRDAAGNLSLIAGDGTKNYTGDGGPASKATFNGMHNVAITRSDDIYIADSWNHCIRKIDGETGIISTIAGTGEAGYAGDGGLAKRATFDFVMCIALDSTHDQLFVADLNNRRIRAVDLKAGTVRHIAGNGEKGVPRDGAQATDSPLVDPRAVAVDSRNQVYILERGGHALRVVTPDGRIKTVAGTGKKGHNDGPALESQLNSPKHLCVDADDNVFIADDQNRAIRKYDPENQSMTTVVGRGIGTPPLRLKRPHGVCIENNKLYVVDSGNDRILRVD